MLQAMRGPRHNPDLAVGAVQRSFLIQWTLVFFLTAVVALAQNTNIPLSETQVKALCLYNFAKYVEWPAGQITNSSAPLSIGIMGNDDFAAILKTLVQGKTINSHPIAIQTLKPGDEVRQCQILFVNASENKRLGDLLKPLKSLPILTVGEGEAFAQAGGVISFVVRNNKVRFDIDLGAAAQARLQISSKLLGLADTVHGKSP